jgi:hypothetical protein
MWSWFVLFSFHFGRKTVRHEPAHLALAIFRVRAQSVYVYGTKELARRAFPEFALKRCGIVDLDTGLSMAAVTALLLLHDMRAPTI